ncbi:MAG: GFA family protein [Pseudomonadota bacterium]
MSRTGTLIDEARGRCLCGDVSFVARGVPATYALCHCKMCRRWTGGAFAEVSVPTEQISWAGGEHIALLASSNHSERAWCRNCGATLFFRHVKKDKWFGSTDLALGLFDDPSQFTLSHEIFSDEACIHTADVGQKRLTRADVLALNPDLEEVQ